MNYVMDYETIVNCFVGVFEDVKTEERKVFVVHELRNDFAEFVKFLQHNRTNKEWHVSFNGLAFDAQITHAILKDSKLLLGSSPDAITGYIYTKAQNAISKSRGKEFQEFAEWNMSIKQIDVFKVNHWDNANKRTSLKWAEYAMDWHNVQEMPIPHTQKIRTQEELDLIISYCINDVQATKQVLHLSKPLLDVRKRIKSKYGLDCYNFSNTKLGSELLLKLYCDKTGQEIREVKQYRTIREQINVGEILFPYIKFQSVDFIGFHEMLKTKVIRNTKKDFTYKMLFKGQMFHYGAGGIHQCIESGIYKSGDGYIIKDLDVASLYPSIACVNGMFPAHLGKEFFQVYKNDIVDVRLAEKSKKENKDMAIIEGFKEAANASYGNSNSPYSWLFDSFYTMQTTINGQLLLTMLVEELLLAIPDAQLLQTNTDGATLRFHEKNLEKYHGICKEWEKLTKLTLEFADYSAMYIWDVNNYIARYTNGKTKCKGRFEWEDLQNHKYTHLHKNKSHLIVAKAIFNFFVNDIPPEKYLSDNRNIFDYCAVAKVDSSWKLMQTCIIDSQVQLSQLQKINRYYVSNGGCKIIKTNITDGRKIQIEAGPWMQTVYNIHNPKTLWKDYDVNEKYYLEAIYQEINNLVPKPKAQLSLF